MLLDEIPPEESRWVARGELGMLGELLPMLDVTGLQLVRMMLRRQDRWPNETPGLLMFRLALLERVCRLLAADDVGALVYYQGRGDVPPDCPDDLSSIAGADDAPP